MSITQKSNKIEITLPLVAELVAEQFPQWADLPIRPVDTSGWDNRTFRLGNEMSVRLPSAGRYESQVKKEQKWLPVLAPHLSITIPAPVVIGQPSKNYPWNWSIYRWIEGISANALSIENSQFNLLASNLAQFLNELHKIDTASGPAAGLHNFFRGQSPSVYDTETRSAIIELRSFIDVETVTSLWETAISSKWDNNPVWIHGDFGAGNILIKNGRLEAIIDFGCTGIGDPACDLVIAWIFLKGESRKVFRNHLSLDSNTWARARGWALWKALITIAQLEDKTSPEAVKQNQVINDIIVEHQIEYQGR